MFMQHVHGACPCFVFKLHLHCAFSRPHVLAACTCCISKCMSMLLLHAACLWCQSMQHVQDMLYGHAVRPRRMLTSMLHVLASFPCCMPMSMLHVMSCLISPVLAAPSRQSCPVLIPVLIVLSW
jgi:hypothetical protein